jgi:hypothetical protein
LRLAQVEAPSQNGTHDLTHACARSQTWVRNTPSHIGASCHLLHSQGHKVCILRCNQNSLEWIPTRCVPWKIPMWPWVSPSFCLTVLHHVET